MVIFLYGQDTYRSRQKLGEIIEHYKKVHKSGLNLVFLDGKGLSFSDFKSSFQQTSMFDEKKLIILSDFLNNQKLKEDLLKNIKILSSSKDIILFFEERKIPKNDSFLKKIKKDAKIQEFELLKQEKLKNWVKKEFLKFNVEITPEALNKIIEFIGDDLWRFSNEIKKLASYKRNRKIDIGDVILLIKPEIETAIFKTIDAVAQKNKEKALLLIHQHIDKGDSPFYLLSMINFQIRNLLIIKDLIEKNVPFYSFSKITGLHPFVIQKSYQQADSFTFQELKNIFQKLFQTDLDIKTGKKDPETALDLLIADI